MTYWAVADPGRLSTGIRASPNPASVRAILSYTSCNDVPVEVGRGGGRARNTSQGRGACEPQASDQKAAVGITCHDGPPLSHATLPAVRGEVAMKSDSE